MAKTKCVPCIAPSIKEILKKEIKDLYVLEQLDKVEDCPTGIILELCIPKKRARSKYQAFVSDCMKKKNIKGRGEAAVAMKECATEWKTIKSQS